MKYDGGNRSIEQITDEREPLPKDADTGVSLSKALDNFLCEHAL